MGCRQASVNTSFEDGLKCVPCLSPASPRWGESICARISFGCSECCGDHGFRASGEIARSVREKKEDHTCHAGSGRGRRGVCVFCVGLFMAALPAKLSNGSGACIDARGGVRVLGGEQGDENKTSCSGGICEVVTVRYAWETKDASLWDHFGWMTRGVSSAKSRYRGLASGSRRRVLLVRGWGVASAVCWSM